MNNSSLAFKALLFFCAFLTSVLTPNTLAANTIDTQLQQKIVQAQKTLSSTEQRIADERKQVVTKLNKLEQEVLALREKAAVAQRLSDEKTLSLSKLEQRLSNWRKQDSFQKNLIYRFLQQHTELVSQTQPVSSDNLAKTIHIAQRLQQNLSPTWRERNIVQSSGEIASKPTLTIGPVTWFWDDQAQLAGLASIHDKAQGLLHSDVMLPASTSAAINKLRTQPEGYITFDPTLSSAMVKQQNTESALQHVIKGGMWTIPIITFGLFALMIAIIKTLQLLRLPKVIRFTPTVLTSVIANNAKTVKTKGMQKALLKIAQSEPIIQKRDDLLFVELQDNKLWLERWTGGIAITAAISPLLGLLGTVSGMIETFKMMTLFGSGDPGVVSGGIAQALVTTELGLVVAIPALILNAVLSRRAKNYYNDLESFAILLSQVDNTTASLSETKDIQRQAIQPVFAEKVSA